MKRILCFLFSMFLSACIVFAQENRLAPDFKLDEYGKDLGGVTLSNAIDSKNVVILSFFDTNCAPCKKEIPKLQQIYSNLNVNTKMFLVCLDEKPQDVLPEFIKKLNITIPILTDPLGYRAGEKYGVIKYGSAEIPQLFVIGKDGIIKKHYKGYHDDIDVSLLNDIKEYSSQVYTKPKNNSIAIIYSGSTNGYLESCDCPQNPFGGIVRKITALRELSEKYPNSINVDSGDFFPPRADKLLTKYCVEMAGMIKYDIMGIGDQEILSGVDYLKDISKTSPLACANLQTCDDKMCFPFSLQPFKVKTVGNKKIAFLSVLNPNIFFLFPKDKMKNVKISDHISYLSSLVPQIRKEADFVVLVSHCGDEDDMKIAQTVKGIDVIVGGHSQTFHKDPLKVNDTLIVQGGVNSHRIGVLELQINSENQITSYLNSFILLDKTVADDPAGRAVVERYKTELKENALQLTK